MPFQRKTKFKSSNVDVVIFLFHILTVLGEKTHAPPLAPQILWDLYAPKNLTRLFDDSFFFFFPHLYSHRWGVASCSCLPLCPQAVTHVLTCMFVVKSPSVAIEGEINQPSCSRRIFYPIDSLKHAYWSDSYIFVTLVEDEGVIVQSRSDGAICLVQACLAAASL